MPNRPENINLEIDSNSSRESINIHLPSDIVEKLEDALFYFRKQLPREKRRKLNRSKIHELILENVFAEYLENGQKGWLGRIITEWGETTDKH